MVIGLRDDLVLGVADGAASRKPDRSQQSSLTNIRRGALRLPVQTVPVMQTIFLAGGMFMRQPPGVLVQLLTTSGTTSISGLGAQGRVT
jgi:hypothetical protein